MSREANQQEQQLNQGLENSQETQQQDSTQQIQQTQNQPDPRIDAVEKKMDSILTLLQQQNSRNVEAATVAPTKTELPTNKEVWENPVEAIGKIIAAQNAPINAAAQELMRTSKLTSIQEQLAMTPQYQRAKAMYPEFEAALKSQLAQVPGEQLNLGSASYVLQGTVGHLALNSTPAPAPAPVQQQTQQQQIPNSNPGNATPVIVPAHLRPTPNTPPTKKPDDAEPELTENEIILARRYGMTPKEYKANQDGNRMSINPLDAGKGA